MKFHEMPRTPLEGGFNVHSIVKNEKGELFLKRQPKDNARIVESLRNEYSALGFTRRGGTFRRRSPEEQRYFLELTAQLGLKTLPPAYTDEKDVNYYPFLEGSKTLEKFLPQASPEDLEGIIYEIFADLRFAHVKGITYGDRWSQNILVVPRLRKKFLTQISEADRQSQPVIHTFVHIDFDLEISGPAVREFEMAQVTFYILCAGRERALPILISLLAIDVNLPRFDFEAFAEFLEQHAKFFEKTKEYGDAEKDISALIAALRTLRGKRQAPRS